MDNRDTTNRRLPSWLRSFRIPRNSSQAATTRDKCFLRTYRRSLGSTLERGDVLPGDIKSNPTRASLMSIREIWAADAKGVATEKKIIERKSKKPCAKTNSQCSPSKIPISPHMKAQQRVLFLRECVALDKENEMSRSNACDCRSSSGDSLGSTNSSEMVMKAAMRAKSRRSSCGCANLNVGRELETAFQKAANQVGLPRTSTQMGTLRIDQQVHRSVPLSPIHNNLGSKELARQRKAVVMNSAQQIGSKVEESQVNSSAKQILSLRPPEDRIGRIPVIPPRTYLSRIAHAKAHLTGANMANNHKTNSSVPRTNCADTHLKGIIQDVSEDVRLQPQRFLRNNAVKQKPLQSHFGWPNVCNVPTNKLPPTRLQNNPSYGFACTMKASRTQHGHSGSTADDEGTVLNCSCERCLQKFTGNGQEEWQKKRASCRSLYRQRPRKPRAPSPPAIAEHRSDTLQPRCKCCNYREKSSSGDVTSVKRTEPVEQTKTDKFIRVQDRKVEAPIPENQESIERIVELAVKASLEKILSLYTLSTRKKSRSVEDLQTLSERKAASPQKYILLSTCTSGRREAAVCHADTESGLGTLQRSCSLDNLPSTDDIESISTDLYNTFLELKGRAKVKHSQDAVGKPSNDDSRVLSQSVLQSLVERTPSFETTKVSTAFIRLIKTERNSKCGMDVGLEKTPADNTAVSATRRISCDPYSKCPVPEVPRTVKAVRNIVKSTETKSGSTEACAMQAAALSPSLDTEERCDIQHDQDGAKKHDCCQENGILCCHKDMSDMLNSTTQIVSGLHGPGDQSREGVPRNCCTTTSSSSLQSRKSPDGWEKTPITDISNLSILEDDESELNLGTDNGEPICTSDTSTDDQKILEELIRKGAAFMPQVKLPSKYPKSPPKTARKYKPRGYFSGKASLKLAAYTNAGHVTVHVIRATKLVTSLGHSANAYVKVSLQPDLKKRTLWRTAIVKNSRNPEFDHKFSFELMPGDAKKRLLITVWHRDLENKRSELLGSMSFSMEKVLSSAQHARGWYRLLKQSLGIGKHFAARCLPEAGNRS